MAGIDQLRGHSAQLTTNRGKTATAAYSNNQPHTPSAAPQSRDAISLSAQGQAVGQIHQQLAAEPSFDSEKVAAIKAAIANGSYTIDAEKLANNMANFEDELRGL